MTRNEKLKITERINLYADEHMKDIDRKAVPISIQLDMLKPVMEEIAAEYGKSVSDIFIIYMDTNSELLTEEAEKKKGEETTILYE